MTAATTSLSLSLFPSCIFPLKSKGSSHLSLSYTHTRMHTCTHARPEASAHKGSPPTARHAAKQTVRLASVPRGTAPCTPPQNFTHTILTMAGYPRKAGEGRTRRSMPAERWLSKRDAYPRKEMETDRSTPLIRNGHTPPPLFTKARRGSQMQSGEIQTERSLSLSPPPPTHTHI